MHDSLTDLEQGTYTNHFHCVPAAAAVVPRFIRKPEGDINRPVATGQFIRIAFIRRQNRVWLGLSVESLMRAAFGVVSLLIALAIVGLVAARQLKAVNSSVSAAVVPGVPGAASAPLQPGNVREQSQQIQKQIADDVAKAMAQGARKDESGQ